MDNIKKIEELLKEIEEMAINFPEFKVDEKYNYDAYVQLFNEKIDVINIEIKKIKQENGISLSHTNLVSRLESAYAKFLIKNTNVHLTNSKKETDLKLENVNKINVEVTDKLNEVIKEVNDFEKVTSNLYNFFGIVVGLLAFIFVNFQLITSATSLSLGKMIIYLGLSNIFLIVGILIIVNFLGFILNKWSKATVVISIISVVFISLLSCFIIKEGYKIYDKIDKPENYQIIKRLEVLENNKNYDTRINDIKSDQEKILEFLEKVKEENNELKNELNKRDLEIEKLKFEIENLKNKK